MSHHRRGLGGVQVQDRGRVAFGNDEHRADAVLARVQKGQRVRQVLDDGGFTLPLDVASRRRIARDAVFRLE